MNSEEKQSNTETSTQVSALINLPVESKVLIIRSLIQANKNSIFSVVFIKKDGTLREMLCRRGVKKGVKGTSKYNVQEADERNNQITVFDMANDGFRKINVDTIMYVRIKGHTYQFSTQEVVVDNTALKDYLHQKVMAKAAEEYKKLLSQYGMEE